MCSFSKDSTSCNWKGYDISMGIPWLVIQCHYWSYFFASFANDLVNYWLDKLNQDPLYLLDQTTRYNVSKKLDKLGSKFELKHFE